jgi:phage tail tape-measure protein
MNDQDIIVQNKDANRDPITGAPGSHPVGTGVGAVIGGASAGAVIGAVAGPIGTVAGIAVGAVLGGLAGKGVAEAIDPTAEEAYWRAEYPNRPYAAPTKPFEAVSPAYKFGWEARSRYPDRSFDDALVDIRSDWEREQPALAWNEAEPAIRDSWNRVETKRFPAVE